MDCNEAFVFTVGEQEFYKQKGFTNMPIRCRNCRAAKKARVSSTGAGSFSPCPLFAQIAPCSRVSVGCRSLWRSHLLQLRPGGYDLTAVWSSRCRYRPISFAMFRRSHVV